MQNSMYSALFGALSNEHRMNSIANNLANVNTTGYKRDMLSFKDTFAMYAHDQIMEPMVNLRSKKLFPEPQHLSRTRIAQAQVDFEQGSLKVTGSSLDVAISGNGFFKVRTPQGDFYTRNGHFRLTGEGMLITEQGYPVLGNGGEITLPAGVDNFTIAENGDIYGDGAGMGSIDLVEVNNPLALEKLGSNLYRPRNGVDFEEMEGSSYMVQGFLEVSNVNPVYEMVNMIETQRQFEAYAKVMQTTEALDKETISKVGRAR
ncbi:MAG: flagellar basal-body rod protein FlgF [Desulfovibrio sp.]|jgi:flagellar basal-body rod protein FlgG|nr:flagellar basal-body rod protein FlgF [Desulfovibrio sp.]